MNALRADEAIITDSIYKSSSYGAEVEYRYAMSSACCGVTNKQQLLGDSGSDHGHCVACRANDGEAAWTTQKRWPVGASMTHQVCTAWIALAPSFSSRRTSASMSSVSISRCTRLAWVTFCTSMLRPC